MRYEPTSSPALTVLEPGPLTTVQDAGRLGYGALGIGPSGACDRDAYRLANRLVGNDEDAAVFEVTFGGLRIHAERTVTIAATGAPCPGMPYNSPVTLTAGREIRLGVPKSGVRTYLAVRGGLDVVTELESRSTDLLGGIGPNVPEAGELFNAFAPSHPQPAVDLAPVAAPESSAMTIALRAGPRADWFTEQAWRDLLSQPYTVTPYSNRTALRLDGNPLERRETGELPSEGLTRGAIQIPPAGTPILFLADHPVTGGYPIIAYLSDRDTDRCAQAQPGQTIRFQWRDAEQPNIREQTEVALAG